MDNTLKPLVREAVRTKSLWDKWYKSGENGKRPKSWYKELAKRGDSAYKALHDLEVAGFNNAYLDAIYCDGYTVLYIENELGGAVACIKTEILK